MNKHLGKIVFGVALVCGCTPLLAAQRYDRHVDHRTHQSHDRRDVHQRSPRVVYRSTTYERVDRSGWYRRGGWAPAHYRDRRYVVTDWRARRLREPPRGYHYVRGDRGDLLLVAISTGIIASILASH